MADCESCKSLERMMSDLRDDLLDEEERADEAEEEADSCVAELAGFRELLARDGLYLGQPQQWRDTINAQHGSDRLADSPRSR
jgi:hypothetical protein